MWEDFEESSQKSVFVFVFKAIGFFFFSFLPDSLDAESVRLFLLQETTHFNGIKQIATYRVIDKDLIKKLIYQTEILILLFFKNICFIHLTSPVLATTHGIFSLQLQHVNSCCSI